MLVGATMSTIGERIKLRRIQLNMSQPQLGEILGTDHKQVWRWETSRSIPLANTLLEIAHALDTTPDWLLGLTDDPSRVLENLSEDERMLIEMWRSKRPEQRKRMLDVVKLL